MTRRSARSRHSARVYSQNKIKANARRIKDYLDTWSMESAGELHESQVLQALGLSRRDFIDSMPFVVILWGDEKQGTSIQRPGLGIIKIEDSSEHAHPWRDASRLLHSVETRVRRLPAIIHHSSMSLDASQQRAVVEAEFARDTILRLTERVEKSLNEVEIGDLIPA